MMYFFIGMSVFCVFVSIILSIKYKNRLKELEKTLLFIKTEITRLESGFSHIEELKKYFNKLLRKDYNYGVNFATYEGFQPEVKKAIETFMQNILTENIDSILKLYEEKINNIVTDPDRLNWTIENILKDAKAQSVEAVSKAYLKDNFIEIIKKIDTQAVANATILRLTGDLTKQNLIGQ